MKVTIEELSRRVAEFIEPKPTWVPDIKERSPGQVWDDCGGGWQPRNMTDPDMCLTLIKRGQLTVQPAWVDGRWIAFDDKATDRQINSFAGAQSIELAVLKSFCLKHHLATREELE